MRHLCWRIGQGNHLCLPIVPKNTNLVEDVKIWLPVKFLWIGGFSGEIEIVQPIRGKFKGGHLGVRSAQKHKEVYMVYIINRPLFLSDYIFSQRQKITTDFISQNFSFHRMTIDFPVLLQLCYIFPLKVVAFCLKYGNIDVFGRIGAYFCLVSIEGGRGQD